MSATAGWGTVHKFLDPEPTELALADPRWEKMARRTLDAALALIDPVWGGMYQYSVGGHWSEPHFEKLISIQADALREYSLAYAQTQNREDLSALQSVQRYITKFLRSPSTGAFSIAITPRRRFSAAIIRRT